MPTLFGEWTVISEWGRIGAPGRVQLSTYADEISAVKALGQRLADKIRRGYCSGSGSLVRCYFVDDVAVSQWSDGSTTISPCRLSSPARKSHSHLPDELSLF
jgi:predicted DNA-binding WGR domain protein